MNYFDIPGVSNSFIGQVRDEALGRPPMNQRSPALRFGKSLHELILEPEKFDFRQYTGPERMEIMKLQNRVKEVAEGHLEGEKEVELFYEYLGWQCKMKADVISQGTGVITDLKSTAKTTFEEFQAAALEYGYHRQAAWYLDAPPVRDMNINTFRIIAVSKIKPYPVFIWTMSKDDPMIESGRDEYRDALEYMSTQTKYNHLKINQPNGNENNKEAAA